MNLYKLTIHADILPEFYWVVASDPTIALRTFFDKMKRLNRTYFQDEHIKNIEIVTTSLIIQND